MSNEDNDDDDDDDDDDNGNDWKQSCIEVYMSKHWCLYKSICKSILNT